MPENMENLIVNNLRKFRKLTVSLISHLEKSGDAFAE